MKFFYGVNWNFLGLSVDMVELGYNFNLGLLIGILIRLSIEIVHGVSAGIFICWLNFLIGLPVGILKGYQYQFIN